MVARSRGNCASGFKAVGQCPRNLQRSCRVMREIAPFGRFHLCHIGGSVSSRCSKPWQPAMTRRWPSVGLAGDERFCRVERRIDSRLSRFPSRELARQSAVAIRRINRVLGSDACPCSWQEADALYVLRDRLQALCNAYPVQLRQKKIAPTDRLRTLFSGPLYTSEAFPWPFDGEAAPLEPVCQIDLGILSALAKVQVGEGLLQLWARQDLDKHLIRVLPRNELCLGNLSPPIEFPGWSCTVGDYSWRQGSEFDHAHVLGKIARPFIDFRNGLESALEEAPIIPFHGLQRSLATLEALIGRGAGLERTEVSFFGSFDAIQYPQSERGCVLVSIEAGIFMFGDHGNAQIFYDIDEAGRVSFSFDWSCP